MANKIKTEPEVEAPVTAEAKQPKAEPVKKFLVEKLRKDCINLFGVTTSTFDGAMYGHDETELSIDEAKAVIDEFLYGGK